MDGKNDGRLTSQNNRVPTNQRFVVLSDLDSAEIVHNSIANLPKSLQGNNSYDKASKGKEVATTSSRPKFYAKNIAWKKSSNYQGEIWCVSTKVTNHALKASYR